MMTGGSVGAEDVTPGYILYTLGGPGGFTNQTTTFLREVDEFGSISGDAQSHTWTHGCGPASQAYLYPDHGVAVEDAVLFYPCRVDEPTMISGGVGGRVEIYDWSGDVLWTYELSNETYQHHHDIAVLPNGNILMIAWERKSEQEWNLMGRLSVDNVLNEMWSTAILEIQPNLKTGGAEVVWEWHLWDHMVQDVSVDHGALYAEDISDHPELMDINHGLVGEPQFAGADPCGDWMHINAIDYNADLDQIVISSKFKGEIYIIDHSTTTAEAAGHDGGDWGRGGDFLYRWGNPSVYDRGDLADRYLFDPHGVNWIEGDYPGGGGLMLFNNRHENLNQSSALEIQPPVDAIGQYVIEPGEPYGPVLWDWIHEVGFYSSIQSGAYRQSNGNTLVTVALSALIFEVSETGDIVWQFTDGFMIPRAIKYELSTFTSDLLLGDVNGDGQVNIVDVVVVVEMILGSEYDNLADLTADGEVNLLDILELVEFIVG